ncbi:methyltransferase [Litchfieldia salsa]|uniref:Methyltransferase domain-containing protein n=1 Tax=Litchfieldia salsa TaxID=930152 RepID=A0A1H0VXM9_9BACI|nr:methyltransferase [Litchfieldia salsa]SDP83031.1 Methyltransferase domain-containing protein [Litchfieldia salsa]
MIEHSYDKLLNIKTTGDQKGFNQSLHYHKYEPTPYRALELLFKQYELNSSDRVVDFGCGKGRLNFYINYVFNSEVIGIEMNEIFYREAIINRNNYLKKYSKNVDKLHFICWPAEEYTIDQLDNRFYFFNPFSVQIFMKVINNIIGSIEQYPRNVELILYYPSEDYIYYLETNTSFELKKEITLSELYENNLNERFLIYKLAY